MANTPQARKRARQNDARRLHNRSRTTMMRTAMKKVLRALRAGDIDKAKEVYRKEAVPVIDRNAKSGIIHANKAARHKSRLNDHIRKAAGA